MAKKDNFDDVLGNKFSLMNAKSSKLLSSWMGPETEKASTAPTTSNSDTPEEDADLKQTDFGHDRLGVGSPIPKDIADGSFTRRAPTSNDKLLEQLIGKKRAKAHLAAKQEAERASARQQPTWQQKKEEKKKVEESEDDEEEGRAAMIGGKGKGRKGEDEKGKVGQVEEKQAQGVGKKESGDEEEKQSLVEQKEKVEEDDDDVDLKPKKRVKKSRAKPASYLDELLAERSKKKKGQGKGMDE